jgi:hypothetical protein
MFLSRTRSFRPTNGSDRRGKPAQFSIWDGSASGFRDPTDVESSKEPGLHAYYELSKMCLFSTLIMNPGFSGAGISVQIVSREVNSSLLTSETNHDEECLGVTLI